MRTVGNKTVKGKREKWSESIPHSVESPFSLKWLLTCRLMAESSASWSSSSWTLSAICAWYFRSSHSTSSGCSPHPVGRSLPPRTAPSENPSETSPVTSALRQTRKLSNSIQSSPDTRKFSRNYFCHFVVANDIIKKLSNFILGKFAITKSTFDLRLSSISKI